MHLEQKPVGYPRVGAGRHGLRRGMDALHRPDARRDPRARRHVSATSSRGMLLLAVLLGRARGARSCSRPSRSSRFLDWFQRFRQYLPWVMRVSGALLVVVGVLLLTGEFTRLAGWLQALTPEVLKGRL